MSGANKVKDGTISELLSRTTKSALLPNEDFIENLIVIPPDGGWGWVIVAMAFVCNFLTDGTMYTFGVFLDEISESFQVLPTKIAFVNSLMCGFYFIVGPLTCALTNRYGFRVVGIIGGLIACIAFFLSTIIINLNVFLVLIGVFCGIGFNMIYIPSLLIVGFYFEKWRAFATAIAVCGSSIGIIVFPPVLMSVMKNFHWTWKFRILSGVTLITCMCAFAFRPIKPVKVTDVDCKSPMQKDDSLGTLNIERDVKIIGGKTIFQSYHNSLYPSASEFHDTSSILISSRRMTDDPAISEASIPRSMFIYKSDNQSLSLSTVYEIDNENPATNENYCNRNWWRKYFCCCSHKKPKVVTDTVSVAATPDIVNRPMYRDDIFYTGSLHLLPEYSKGTVASDPSTKKSGVSYHLSVTRMATQRDIKQNRQCVCCPEAVVRTIATMLHLRLLKSPTFVMLTISGFFTTTGLYCPYIFLVQRAFDMNIKRDSAVLLLTIVGVANTVGRILCGVISWFPKIDAMMISYITLITAGVATIASSYLKSFEGQIVFAVLFGFNVGNIKGNFKGNLCISAFLIPASVTVLRSLVIVELVGLENLTNAFGITTMFYGIGSFIGVPVAALLRNYTGKYDASFILAGCLIILSGILLIPLRRLSAWETTRGRRVYFKD